MTNKLFYITGLILFYNFISFSQNSVTFFTIVSYNNYSMSEMAGLQNELLNDMLENNIPADITESFPAYVGFKIGFLIPVDNNDKRIISLGGILQHNSTGGRIHYGDYSGEIGVDQILKVTSIGAILNYESHMSPNFDLALNFSINYMISGLSNEIYLKVGDESQNEELNFNSYSFGLEPEIIPSFNMGIMRFGISLSYLVYFSSSLEYESFSDAYLVNNNGDKVNINWSGFRIGLLASISL